MLVHKCFVTKLQMGVDHLRIGPPMIPSTGVRGKKSLMIPPVRNAACEFAGVGSFDMVVSPSFQHISFESGGMLSK